AGTPSEFQLTRGWSLEADRGGGPLGGVFDLEELLRREAALVGDDRGGELLDLRVEALDVRVVDPAGGLDLVLELREVPAQLLEVLGRLQIRVLLGDGAEIGQRAVQPGL